MAPCGALGPWPLAADDLLGKLIHLVAVAFAECILILGFHKTAADVNGVQLIAADAPVENRLSSGRGVERPLVIVLHDGQRKRRRQRGDIEFFGGVDHCIGGLIRGVE